MEYSPAIYEEAMPAMEDTPAVDEPPPPEEDHSEWASFGIKSKKSKKAKKKAAFWDGED